MRPVQYSVQRDTNKVQCNPVTTVKGSCGTMVPDMDERSKCLAPEGHSKARFLQHGSDALRENTSGTLCNAILLGARSNSVLVLYAALVGECEHGIAHVLPSLSSRSVLILLVIWFSANALNYLKVSKTSIYRVIVDECDPIAISRECGIGNSMNIRMDKL
jgi:hypothetical protein